MARGKARPSSGRGSSKAAVGAAAGRKLSIPSLAAQKIRVNYKDFSEEQTDVLLHQGLTLRQTLERDIGKERGGEKMTFGKSYHSALRRSFSKPSDTHAALVAASSAGPAAALALPDAEGLDEKLVRPSLFKAPY